LMRRRQWIAILTPVRKGQAHKGQAIDLGLFSIQNCRHDFLGCCPKQANKARPLVLEPEQ
jgi:hypothetical protein